MQHTTNKMQLRKHIIKGIFHLLLIAVISFEASAQQTVIQYLSGTDKDHTVKWDFMVTMGRNSGVWSTIPVPSNWEMQGFGNYYYGTDGKDAEQGMYKHTFKVPK
ncbi:MAG: hypothetical protein ABIS01_13330, partial [Ferruginibacter sp.]